MGTMQDGAESVESGRRGEARAEAALRAKGFRVVARNWRSPWDRRLEIDLVCLDGEILVFVEVKARSRGARVPGFWAVDGRKRRALRRAVAAYLRLLRRRPRTHRCDVVAVEGEGSGSEILHYQNVDLDSKRRWT